MKRKLSKLGATRSLCILLVIVVALLVTTQVVYINALNIDIFASSLGLRSRYVVGNRLHVHGNDHLNRNRNDHLNSNRNDHLNSNGNDHLNSNSDDHLNSNRDDHLNSNRNDHLNSNRNDHLNSNRDDHLIDSRDAERETRPRGPGQAVEVNLGHESESVSSHTSKGSASRRGSPGRTSPGVGPAAPPNSTERFFIYQCRRLCGGWGDRLRGIVTAYIIATLTNRTFGIQVVDNKCPFTDHLQPNEVNWEIPKGVDLQSGSETYSRLDNARFYAHLAWVDLDEIFPTRVVFFKSNLEHFIKIKPNKLYIKQLEWMQPLSRAEVFAVIYRKLFKFSPRVQATIDSTLKLARPTAHSALICGHVRFASNAGNFSDTEKRHTDAHAETMLNFVQTFDPASPEYNGSRARDVLGPSAANASSTRFFVTSDSVHFMDKAAEAFGDRFIKTEGKLVHMDRPALVSKAGCDSFTKVLVDQHLMSTCDVLVVSKSGLSGQAAYLRGTDRGLYCLFMNGRLEKCSAGTLREAFDQNVK